MTKSSMPFLETDESQDMEVDSQSTIEWSQSQDSQEQISKYFDDGPEKKRPRQGVLDFSNGRLTTKKPLINPISRNDDRRKALASVAEETILLLPGLLATRPDVVCDSYLCRRETLDPAKHPGLRPATVRVIDSDTIDAALALSRATGQRVAVLNMANATHPGGGWKHGAMAQEEAICYRSSLSSTLHRKHYPIPDNAAVYSPSVMIIRDNFSDGHELLDFRDPSRLEVVSVISAAAVCQPALVDSHGLKTYRDAKDIKLMKEKMRVILRTAIRNRHRHIVLGAFGCGAFGNPNHIVAEMWKSVLTESEFSAGYWRDVVFAVLDGKGVSNFKVFRAELDGLQV